MKPKQQFKRNKIGRRTQHQKEPTKPQVTNRPSRFDKQEGHKTK